MKTEVAPTPREVEVPLFERSADAYAVRRKEPREVAIRPVEYCRFPRIRAEQHLQRGVTRDISASGLCLHAEAPEPVGALLRVILRRVDGRRERESIVRVAWSRPCDAGGHWLGLAEVASAGSRSVRIRYLRPPLQRAGAA